ncbi:MAG: BrnT family toxin [Gammaproteobacteria bacterium]|nr:BrnT family toxin [Gammaproteobacteria bacterium]
MNIEWDAGKAAENLHKHDIDFADAIIALEDENALTLEDIDHNEQRFKTLGMGPKLNILYVIHTYRENEHLRIISARKANRSETKQYYKGLDYE